MTIAPEEVMMLNFLLEDKSPGAVPLDHFIARALRALRSHLGLETAFVSRHIDGKRVMQCVDSARKAGVRLDAGVSAGQAGEGLQKAPAEVCVPICMHDGAVYGALTCVNAPGAPALKEGDLRMIRVFAEMLAEHIEAGEKVAANRRELIARIEGVLGGGGVSFLYQPIFDIKRAQIIGFEALARFPGTAPRGPELWFSDAARVALDVALERTVLVKALEGFAQLPADVFIGFNMSPAMVLSGQLDAAFSGMPLDRVLIEINEHVSFRQYDELASSLAPMRERGLRVSVDEAGGGLESYRHVLSLKPDIIKLNRSLVRNIDNDAPRRALVAGLIQFAREQQSTIIAEGIETAAQLTVLRALGVTRMQGYLLGRPAPLEAAAALCQSFRSAVPHTQVESLEIEPQLTGSAAVQRSVLARSAA